MRYVPGQPSKEVRLDRRRIELVSRALKHFETKAYKPSPTKSRLARKLRIMLPQQLPYVLSLYAHEWEIVSRALRPDGSHPVPGTEHARWYALYTNLRRTFVFKTQGQEDTLRRAKQR